MDLVENIQYELDLEFFDEVNPLEKRVGAYVQYASNTHTGSELTENLTGGQLQEILMPILKVPFYAPLIQNFRLDIIQV